jgi:hypothetical protein
MNSNIDAAYGQTGAAVLKRIRAMGLCVIAALALTGSLAASAQAARHANTGPVKFTASSMNAPNFEPTLEPEGAGIVRCASETAVGEITTAFGGPLTSVFTGCTTETTPVKPCTSEGEPTGTIKTEELDAEIGFINRENREVGTDFKPASGEFLVKFDCPGKPDIYFALKRSVIGRLEAPSGVTTTATYKFKGSLARQEVEAFEGALKDTLLFQISTKGKTGWEKGEIVEFGGDLNLESILTTSPQQERRGRRIKSYPDAVKVVSSGGRPEFVRCRKAAQAKWKNTTCTEKAFKKNGKFLGHYEFIPVPS